MPIINSSGNLYSASGYSDALFDVVFELDIDFAAEVGYSGDTTFDAELELNFDFAPVAASPYHDTTFDSILELETDFAAESFYPGDASFDVVLEIAADFTPDSALVLTDPEPITTTVSNTAFSNQRFAAGGGRLYINNVLTQFIRAEINAPGASLGKSLKIELARADLALLPVNATFKFQIGKIVSGAAQWTTILDGGKLDGRQFSMSANRDSLSFSTTTETDKLNKCPKNNLIVYDPAKGSVSTAEIEAIPTNTGEVIGTSANAVAVLSLHKLLNIAFVTGCGFASVSTDIPNYEIARCDFSVTNTYAAAVAQFIGVYEPAFVVDAANNLTIRKTVNPLPPGFTPNPLYASRYPNFTESAEYPQASIDGYILQYTARAGTSFVDRNLPTVIEPNGGTFGDADFTETTINQKMRDWYEDGVVTRSELKAETRETKRGGVTVGMESLTNNFDALGRGKGYSRTLKARMPDVNNNGAPALLTTREEAQKITYKPNPFQPRQTITSKIETSVKGLLAIDADNTALDSNGEDSPYAQDYEKVFEAGNLTKQMTSAFQTLENTVEYFRPTASGQIESRIERFDALRGKPKPPVSDIRSGDISIPNFTKQKTKTIFKPGVMQGTRTGKPLIPLNVGELPLFFAEPLADWLLTNGRITGQIEIAGFDESIERGVFFNLRGRSDESLGNFLINGYRVLIEPGRITTNIDALKV